MGEAAPIEPDGKDWTFVITDGCAQCGFTPPEAEATGTLLRAAIPRWRARLAQPDARSRPEAATWSPLEYACHVRDVCRVFAGRLQLMLAHPSPTLSDWDQDAAAVEGHYHAQDPATVADELEAEATRTAAAFDAVEGADWERPGLRSNGSAFTVATLATYFTHDVQHHLHDVNG